MTHLLRSRLLLAALAALTLLSLVVPSVDARIPRAKPYRVGGPITLDTNLRSVSGASAWAIDEYLQATTPLPRLGAAFLDAERKYGVNARFLLAAAMHETAWGTSDIARFKHNLFGYNAYDRSPFRSANAYATFAANIDATAKFIRDFYLTPHGRWWGGAPTLRSMQRFWSSSGNWGVNVSRIATSIHLDTFGGGSLHFAAPVVRGRLHGGDQISAMLTWSGRAMPAGVTFVASWSPVQLDADLVAAAKATVAGADGAVDGRLSTPGAAGSSVAPTRPAAMPTAARQIRRWARSVALAVTAPHQPGTYLLTLDMRDTDGHALPAAQRIHVPAAEVRIWADRSVSIDLTATPDGTGAVVRVTNTGRVAIPAVTSGDASATGEPDAAARSVVNVIATSANMANPAPVLLTSMPLTADLVPGASFAVTVPDIAAATGRTTSWLSASLDVLGDPTTLAAYSPAGAWFSDTGLTTVASDNADRAGLYEGPANSPDVTQLAFVIAVPASTTAPGAAQAPSATPTPTPSPTPTPPTTPKPTPARRPSPTVQHVTRVYSEHSNVVYRGGWGSAPNSAYMGGSVAWSNTAGASATFSFTGRSVSWIGPLGPTRGLALVLIDGRAVARVSLWRSSFDPRALLFQRAFKTAGRHTLTIRVLSAPGHPTVAIDGFVVRS